MKKIKIIKERVLCKDDYLTREHIVITENQKILDKKLNMLLDLFYQREANDKDSEY